MHRPSVDSLSACSQGTDYSRLFLYIAVVFLSDVRMAVEMLVVVVLEVSETVVTEVVAVIIMIMSVFLERFPCETCSVALNRCKYKNTKHMHIKHSKQ